MADLLKTDLDVPTRDERAHRPAVDHPTLGANRLGDAKPREELGEEIDAAGARRKGDRLRLQQGLHGELPGIV